MSIFVYCPRPSTVATDLATALGASRLRKFDGLNFWNRGKILPIPKDSVIVNWGGRLPDLEEVRVLNHVAKPLNRFAHITAWKTFPVRTHTTWVGPRHHISSGSGYTWLPRRAVSTSCEDLLNPPVNPDFWAAQLPIEKEYRLQVFGGRTIRSGVKVLRPDFVLATSHEDWMLLKDRAGIAHPWWRHFDTGWTTDYKEFTADAQMRKLAVSAVKALGLTFGAVDVGTTSDGHSYVLSCTPTPYLDSYFLTRYTKLVNRWIEAPNSKPEEDEPIQVDDTSKVAGTPTGVFADVAVPPPTTYGFDPAVVENLRRAVRANVAVRRGVVPPPPDYGLVPQAPGDRLIQWIEDEAAPIIRREP